MKTSAVLLVPILAGTFWFTADQQGQRQFRDGDFKAAAESFTDPMWKGAALYRAGEFEAAATTFSRSDAAEAHFNRGNCLVFLGQYEDAVASYDRALKRRPDWREAVDNREIARLRAERLKNEGGDLGDQKLGADEIVFDKKQPGGQDTQLEGQTATDDQSTQALWLRRVQTRPADFLKAKFAYQQRFEEEGGDR